MEIGWHIELLGGLRATRGDREITRFRTQKTGVLLACLAYDPGRSHQREELIERLWPGAEPLAGSASLRQALSSLRRQLEPPDVPPGAVLLTNRVSVRLNPSAVTTDVAAFHTALHAAAAATTDAERAHHLMRAVDLYHGELLPGYYETWVLGQREHLAESYFQALGELLALLERAGDLHRAVEIARHGVLTDPLREEARRDLMRLYAAVGEPDAALRQYRELERLLRHELEAEPSPATRSLAREIAADARKHLRPSSASLLEAAGETPATGAGSREDGSTPPRFPTPLTRFFGREEELARLRKMLLAERRRLVTLTGPGGSGKTRLATEAVARLAEAWLGAVGFVLLAALTDAEEIPSAIRDGLGLPPRPTMDPLDQVSTALARRPTLLLLDNYEHLVEGGARLVQTLLARIPTLTCLITSRRHLDLAGERVLPVLALPTPGQADPVSRVRANPSVQLFVDRAQGVDPNFSLTEANAPAVAAVCRRLEGIPLALELAAARLVVLTPAELLAHLERRFDFLVSRERGGDDRHRTLRAAIDWSSRLLSPELRRFFARLSVFRGGWTLAAAEAVCEAGEERFGREADSDGGRAPGQALNSLEQLRLCSLVLAEPCGEEMRYRLLETLREYAAEQLTPEEQAALALRHGLFFLALAESAAPRPGERDASAELQAQLERLDRDVDNLRAALAWSQEEGGETALRLAAALPSFWETRGYRNEGRRWLESALARTNEALLPTAARARVLMEAGWLAGTQGDLPLARSRAEESLAICRTLGDRQGIVLALSALGCVVRDQGEYEAARSFFAEAVETARASGEAYQITAPLYGLGTLAFRQGDLEAAHSLFTECLALARKFDQTEVITRCLTALGEVARWRGEYQQGAALFEESLAITRKRGPRWQVAWALNWLGQTMLSLGNPQRALALCRESLTIFQELGDLNVGTACLEGLARVYSAQGQPDRSAQLFGAADAQRAALGLPRPLVDRADYEGCLAATRAALGEEAFASAWAKGQALTLEQAIAAALETIDNA